MSQENLKECPTCIHFRDDVSDHWCGIRPNKEMAPTYKGDHILPGQKACNYHETESDHKVYLEILKFIEDGYRPLDNAGSININRNPPGYSSVSIKASRLAASIIEDAIKFIKAHPEVLKDDTK